MTSNIGTSETVDIKDPKEVRSHILREMRQHFRPEFLNRLDDIIVFNRLGLDEVRGIVDVQLELLAKRLEDRKITLKVKPKAKDLLAQQGYDPVYGARPLKRVMQKLLQDPLAVRLLQGELKEGQEVMVDAQGEDLVFI